ncbi:TIR domain-containing protein [Mesorhizobium sp. M0830]|uniref:nSTAND1 domain-containing NTPase n=1 Tax=Mesorhizobium sp. M0830 TaxID=2957008 RepID=UPI0033394EA0
MARIFLSHSSRNNAQAIALRDWLVANGWGRDDVFLDIDATSGIAPGERWQKALNEAANRCEAVIFLISQPWLASQWCHEELALAHKLNKRLFGILIDTVDVAGVPARLRDEWQLIDLESGRDGIRLDVELPNGQQGFATYSASGLDRLRAGLVKAGLDPRFFAWPPANDPRRAPYRGLAPMEAEDAGIFYGREAATIAALDQLRGLAEAASPRLMAVLGASGAGKSSFMRAGLIPRLKRDDRNFLVLPILRPERAAITGKAGLIAAITTAGQSLGLKWTRAKVNKAVAGDPEDVAMLFSEVGEAALRRISGAIEETAPAIILPIDQAEELFLEAGQEEAQRLLALITTRLKAEHPRLIALATIRTDSYEKLQYALAQAEIREVPFSLPALARGAYQRVIEGPAERLAHAGRTLIIEPALTAVLLSDIEEGGAKDALPLLAFTLERLFVDHGGDGDLTLAEYRTSGGISGAIEAAVERAFAAADADPGVPGSQTARLALLRRAMIPWLAGIDPETKTARRQVARFTDIPDEARPLIEHFVEQRLLATDVSAASGERTIEPAHEALLRQWGLIDGWLKEDIAVLATLEAVRRAARDWDANGRDTNWLAHSGGRLEEAEAIKLRVDLARRLDALDLTYLEAARAAENTLRDRELDEARKLAAAAEAARANETVSLAALSRVALSEGQPAHAVKLALAAWPRIGDSGRPALRRTVDSLVEAFPVFRRGSTLNGHELAVTSATFSPDGTDIVTASADGTARVWEAATGAQVLALKGHEKAVTSAAFSPDGTRIVTASADRTARVWEAATGAQLIVTAHQGELTSAAFSPDGTRVVTASADRTARLWDIATGEQVLVLHGEHRVTSVAFSPDGMHIVTASHGTARIWNAATGAQVLGLEGHKDTVNSAVFSPDSRRLVTASDDQTACLWDAATGRQMLVLGGHEHLVSSAAFSPDSMRIVTTSSDKTARVWDASTGALVLVLNGHGDHVASAAFSPDASRLVTASWDKTARVWDAAPGAQVLVLNGHGGGHEDDVSSAAFSPDATRLVTASWHNHTASIWDLTSGAQVQVLSDECLGSVSSAAFSPNGTRIVTGSSWHRTNALVWDAVTGAQVLVLREHEDTVAFAAFSPDGTRIVTTSLGTARIWDAATGAQILALNGHSAAFSSDGMRIVTASGDRTARIWDAATGAQVLEMHGHEEYVTSAAFSPDGMRLVTASGDGTTRVWDAVSGAQALVLNTHEYHADFASLVYSIRSAEFSPDSKRILTASHNTVRIWDSASGAQLLALAGHDEVISATFSPDGTRVIAVLDKIVRIWDVSLLEKGDIFQIACQRLGRNADLSDVEARYRLSKLAPICGEHAPLPFDPARVR